MVPVSLSRRCKCRSVSLGISEGKLGHIDHVIIGPSGVIGVTTHVFDRPAVAEHPDPHLVANAALTRSQVDELTQRAGLRCDILTGIGRPDPLV
jgi:hypothetical protein